MEIITSILALSLLTVLALDVHLHRNKRLAVQVRSKRMESLRKQK